VFAAFNEYGGPKDITVFEWDGHEGGRAHFQQRAMEFLEGVLG
jgi:cephalosporin-C deacetylase